MIKNQNLDFKSGEIRKVLKREVTMTARWISVKQTAERLSVHEMTVRDWVNRGLVPAVRIGRTVRIDLRTLETQLETQAQGQAAGRGQK